MMEVQNLTGRRFERLVCLKRAERQRYWICQCDCGNVKEIRDNHMTMGKVKTCSECALFELPGKKIGNLTVIEYCQGSSGPSRARVFKCVCDCGRETHTQATKLTRGLITSCGHCLDVKSMIGKKFGYLRVISYSHLRGSDTKWVCQCDCGREKVVGRNSMMCGSVESCGCKRFVEGSMQGERGKVNVLKEADVIKIRQLWAKELVDRAATGVYKANYSQQDLATMYGVSCTCIFNVVNSRNWFFLPPVQKYIEELGKKRKKG